MNILDTSIIPGLLNNIARNVEGGTSDIRLHAERNDTGWQLWASGLKGTWYLHVVKGAQHWTSDTLVAELREDGKPSRHLHWAVKHELHHNPTNIQREISAYFIDEAARVRKEPAGAEQH